ncbi:MAG: hypothetical protein EOO06_13470 [Chitinophagaceae bacterium]|nr:MAG: hypothetical protein EOO06_13470 [Chitinophagaceae bacterium]
MSVFLKERTITMIGSTHRELGHCTADALVSLFSMISPDVIFEELPPSLLDTYYKSKNASNLESMVIERYTEIYGVPHFPVDTDDMPTESFKRSFEMLDQRIRGLDNGFGDRYRKALAVKNANRAIGGFPYLNSEYFERDKDLIDRTFEIGLGMLCDDHLNECYASWQALNERRELEMIENIGRHCTESHFRNAVFTIGAAHRKSILDKVESSRFVERFDVRWVPVEQLRCF